MIKPTSCSLVFGAVLLLALAGCDRADRSKLESDAKQTVSTAKQAARNAGDEIKRETKEVGDTAGQVIGDTAITAKVKTALHAEKNVRSRDIDVETFQGKVVLKGTVADKRQVELAAQVAGSVDGVKSVENRLVVD
jgi:hyperosmotically inducible periplasmic protein